MSKENAQALGPPIPTMTHEPMQSSKQGQGKIHPWRTGEHGTRKVKAHALDILLELKLSDFDLAEALVAQARQGEGWAITYIYNRLAGLPVQRLEQKLLMQVDEHADRLAREHGLDIVEIRDRAKQIAQGT